MLPLFTDTRLLDASAKEKFNLTDDILMENAASAMQKLIANLIEENRQNFNNCCKNKTINVLIVCGSGDNGGDGWCLARKLCGENIFFNSFINDENVENGGTCEPALNVKTAQNIQIAQTENSFSIKPIVYEAKSAKSFSCIEQKKRAILAGVQCVENLNSFIENETAQSNFFQNEVFQSEVYKNNFCEQNAQNFTPCHFVIDCLFGSGFSGTLEEKYFKILSQLNKINAIKIACDIPSGLKTFNNPNIEKTSKIAFIADFTVTMGALKLSLFDDFAKDFCGKIICATLGISEKNFLQNACADAFLLQKSDLILPKRTKQNVHKGIFGHALIACGAKPGAAVLASSSAYGFGAGLVTLCCAQNPPPLLPLEIMYNNEIPKNVTAFACGMGLGKGQILEEWAEIMYANANATCVLDADFFYYENIEKFLMQRSKNMQATVLTPHPKEFSVLLKNCQLGEYSNEEIQCKRLELASQFCQKFSNIVLLLKGANPIIACNFFNNSTFGENIEKIRQSGQVGQVGQNMKIEKNEKNVRAGKIEKTLQNALNLSYNKEKTLLLINNFGSPCLAKGGTGDILSGLICALLAQGYSALDAAVSASLAHALASQKIECSFGLTAEKLINAVQSL